MFSHTSCRIRVSNLSTIYMYYTLIDIPFIASYRETLELTLLIETLEEIVSALYN